MLKILFGTFLTNVTVVPFLAVKRLMREAEELREPTEEYYAQPLDVSIVYRILLM